MKIAIMTQPLGKNYGGIMQAWALQQVLKRMGHEVTTINHRAPEPGRLYQVSRLGYRFIQKVFGERKVPINFERFYSDIFANNIQFIDKYINYSENIDSVDGLRTHFGKQQYDTVIVGSDQVWRPQYSPNIYNYFLDFLESENIKRIAYASSFGVDVWEFTEEQTDRCSHLAKAFDVISVREDSGVDLCKTKLGVDAEFVLDPTLLLETKDYEALIGGERISEKSKGIYTYFLDKTPSKIALAKQVSDRLSEEVYSRQPKCSVDEKTSENISDYVVPDIKDWLAGFANASYVLTDSFHGVVFSLIFNKPFSVVVNVSRGSSRFDSLLGCLGMTDLMLDEKECGKGIVLHSSLFGYPFSEKLLGLKLFSVSVLSESLSQC